MALGGGSGDLDSAGQCLAGKNRMSRTIVFQLGKAPELNFRMVPGSGDKIPDPHRRGSEADEPYNLPLRAQEQGLSGPDASSRS